VGQVLVIRGGMGETPTTILGSKGERQEKVEEGKGGFLPPMSKTTSILWVISQKGTIKVKDREVGLEERGKEKAWWKKTPGRPKKPVCQ